MSDAAGRPGPHAGLKLVTATDGRIFAAIPAKLPDGRTVASTSRAHRIEIF